MSIPQYRFYIHAMGNSISEEVEILSSFNDRGIFFVTSHGEDSLYLPPVDSNDTDDNSFILHESEHFSVLHSDFLDWSLAHGEHPPFAPVGQEQPFSHASYLQPANIDE